MAEFTEEMRSAIWKAVHTVPAADLDVLFTPPHPGRPRVSGIDALLTSPSILTEFFRRRALARRGPENPEAGSAGEASVRSLAPGELADLVWRQLFTDHTPLSEAARTVLTTLGLLGIDVSSGDLRHLREQFDAVPAAERAEQSAAAANCDLILYRAECLDPEAAPPPGPAPSLFRPVLWLTGLLADWKESARRLRSDGYGLKARVDEFTPLEFRRYIAGEITRLRPAAIGLGWPAGHHPRDGGVGRLVREGVLPLCRERQLPFFIGFRESRPDEPANTAAVEDIAPLWEDSRDVRFLLLPGREDQLFPALLAAARCHNVLLGGPAQPAVAGPSVLHDFTLRRLETLGPAFHACQSGAESPEELAGRWAHLRWTLGTALIRQYADLQRTGWQFCEAEVTRDAAALLGGNARSFLGL